MRGTATHQVSCVQGRAAMCSHPTELGPDMCIMGRLEHWWSAGLGQVGRQRQNGGFDYVFIK